ncbi:transposable element Tc1 transposase [Trichonephila clavipes]|nr:transposable element Tc1 transposase [Trichonephila clavipes]
MPHSRIRAHYKQLSEFERGPIVGLREGGWANRRIAGHMMFTDESCFHLCSDDNRRHVWRRPWQRADHAFTTARHTGPQQGVMQDNAKPKTTRFAMNCLIAFQILPWPTRLPDPSLIGLVGDMMGRRLHLPGNVYDLTQQLEQLWQEIP